MVSVLVEELDRTLNSWMVTEVKLDVDSDFSIDDTNMDGELCRIGQLLAKYGEVQAKLRAQLSRHENDVEVTYSREAQKIRSNTQVKTTEKGVEEQVTLEPSYQAALLRLSETQKDSLMVDNFFKAIMKKADALNALTYFRKEEYRRGDL